MFQCKLGRDAPEGDPTACGSVKEGTGYGCFLESLINTWRREWSSGPAADNTTSPLFPVGVVSLAGGTSEGYGNNMGSFRLSQAGGTGLLPTRAWPNTFVAQAFDSGEPGDGPTAAANWHTAVGPYASRRGLAPFTGFFMGGIHPRPKRAVGQRLAHAARALVYGDAAVAYTGPVVMNCSVRGGSITVDFDPRYLQNDVVAVRQATMTQPLDLSRLAATGALAAFVQTNEAALYSSPLEVQYGGTNLTDGLWLSAHLHTQCQNGGNTDQPHGYVVGNTACGINTTTGAVLPGFSSVTADLPLGSANSSDITGVRYGSTAPHTLPPPPQCLTPLLRHHSHSSPPAGGVLTVVPSADGKVRVSRQPLLPGGES